MNKQVYPWVLVGLLSFNFGVVYFDRNTINFLMPLIQPELHLSNSQIGLLGSVWERVGRWPGSGSAGCRTPRGSATRSS